ncbi:hypothetical protein FRB94_014425 [Tulasnella sp. JGI-2019a]|nr:hypothetical protein FRB94_014425 [Tulasnella sp. JGI-2019a]
MTKERNLWKARAEKAEKVLGYRPGEDDEDDEESAQFEVAQMVRRRDSDAPLSTNLEVKLDRTE